MRSPFALALILTACGASPAVRDEAVAHLAHASRLAAPYRLVSVAYEVDGAPVLSRDDASALAAPEAIDVSLGRLAPGRHVLDVTLAYRIDAIGVWAYLADRTLTFHDTHPFEVPSSGSLRVQATVYEHGEGALDERVGVRFVDAPE